MYSGSVVGWIISTKGNICPCPYEKANSLLNLKIKASFLPIWNRLSVQWNETLLQAVGNKKKWLMFCLLFLTPCSRTAMAIAGFKVNQSNFGQTSLSSQSWVVTSNQSVQNGRTVQNYLVSWKKKCIQHHLRLIVFVL